MTGARLARTFILLSPAILLLATVAFFILKPVAGPNPENDNTPSASSDKSNTGQAGRLVVLVIFDQLRGDYLERWKEFFGSDGFEQFKRDGVWYSNVRIPYSVTSTAPGHASLVTGAPPSVHGIIENKWFDRNRGTIVTAGTMDGVQRIPADETATRERWPGLSPKRLLAPTVADILKSRSKNSKVISLSLKDRAAALMGGQEPNGAYCFDSNAGEFHTSSHYRERIPGWVDTFDRSRIVYRWSGKTWDRFGPSKAYEALGADDVIGEGGRIYGGRRTFPYSLGVPDDRSRNYFEALEYSAFGNELLWEFAKAAITGESLGRNATMDLLCISFSSNDMIGHAFGPDSHEVLDITLRSDKLLGEMTEFLDANVGKNLWSMVVTADHGICPLPEVASRSHPDARRIGLGDVRGLDEYLDKVFGLHEGVPGQWLDRNASLTNCYPWLYLNRRLIDAMGLKLSEVESAAAAWLRERPTPLAVFTRSDLVNSRFVTEQEQRLGPMVQRSFNPERSGDLYVVHPAFSLIYDPLSQGTDHGTPHDYDRHIPVLARGAGVPKLGERNEALSSLIVAPLLAKLLGIDPPAKALEPLPESFIQSAIPITNNPHRFK